MENEHITEASVSFGPAKPARWYKLTAYVKTNDPTRFVGHALYGYDEEITVDGVVLEVATDMRPASM